MKALYVILGAVLFLTGVFLTYYQAVQTEDLSWWGETFPFLNFVFTSLTMFCGIVFGCLFRQVVGTNRKINVLKELSSVLQSSSFIAALCVSPFVFMSAYAVVSESPGDPASYLLAFQNGFFCEAIFQHIQKSLLANSIQEQQTAPPEKAQL